MYNFSGYPISIDILSYVIVYLQKISILPHTKNIHTPPTENIHSPPRI